MKCMHLLPSFHQKCACYCNHCHQRESSIADCYSFFSGHFGASFRHANQPYFLPIIRSAQHHQCLSCLCLERVPLSTVMFLVQSHHFTHNECRCMALPANWLSPLPLHQIACSCHQLFPSLTKWPFPASSVSRQSLAGHKLTPLFPSLVTKTEQKKFERRAKVCVVCHTFFILQLIIYTLEALVSLSGSVIRVVAGTVSLRHSILPFSFHDALTLGFSTLPDPS